MTSRLTVCPVGLAGMFSMRIRRLVHNPGRLLASRVGAGDRVLEIGCGPGFFTPDLARLVGPTGSVVAVDLQQGMLDRLAARLAGSDVARRVRLVRCDADHLGVAGPFDFVLLFYVLHEVPDATRLFRELALQLAPGATVLLVEPPLHVSAATFAAELAAAAAAGLAVVERPAMFPDKAVVLAAA
jgi:ubiquinone/menaquinone biosynthesis C-methylase UbiE